MSVYSVEVLADQLVISTQSKDTVDALGKAYELDGKVEVKVDPGGGTKRYFGICRLLSGAVVTAQDGDYLIRDAVTGQYTQAIKETTFEEEYTLVDESS